MTLEKGPFFSIIIPTYNRAHTIRRPIDSIIAQTYSDWELIIVDDGSMDNTKEIVASYQDPRIKYVWQKNQERSAARNHGITLAKGDWICFQDSDDEYLPQHLEVLKKAIIENPNYKVFRTGLFIFEKDVFYKKTISVKYNKYDPFPYDCFHTFVFKKEVLINEKFAEKYNNGEDFHFLVKVGLSFDIFTIAEQWTGIYHYDATSSGGVGPNYEKNLLNRRAGLDDILQWDKVLIKPYLKRARCLTEILLLNGHLIYNKGKVLRSVIDNIKILFRFPVEYMLLIWRIVYVKFGEFSGLYNTRGRF